MYCPVLKFYGFHISFISIAILAVVDVVVLPVWSNKPAMFCGQVQGHNCDAGLWTGHVRCGQLPTTSSCS